MIRPTPRLVLLFACGLPLAVAPAVLSPRLWPAWVVFTAACVALAGADAMLLARARDIGFALEAPARLYIGEAGEATLAKISVAAGVVSDLAHGRTR